MRHSITQVTTNKDGGTYKVSLRIPEKGWISEVKFHILRLGEYREHMMDFVKEEGNYACFETEVKLWNSPLYQYYFSFYAGDKFQYYKKENRSGETSITREECFKMSVNFNVPDWAKGCVVYQVFPDRFCMGKDSVKKPMARRHLHDSWNEQPVLGPDEEGLYNNDYFGGDFAGIKEKADYIASLGVDMVYLNPIVASQSNHRYDTADYFHADPYLGTNAELKHMIQELHKRGIRTILDGVYNHTGNDSVYFNEYGTYDSEGAYQNPKSPYSRFYEKDRFGNYQYWWGFHNLPVCDKTDPEFKNMIFGVGGVIDKWCELGIDGLRLDVVDELTDDFLMGIWKAMQRNRPNDFIIIGEVWENAMRKGKTYISSGKEMHSVMDYFLMDALLRYYMYADTWKLDRVLREILTEYPTETIQTLMNSTSTHDMSRLIEILGCDVFNYHGEHAWDIDWHGMNEEEKNEWMRNHKMTQEEYLHGKKVMESYVTALAFLPGMFTIFYGDEIGLQGIGNLLNRATYPWGNEDVELLEFYKRLIKSRKSEDFLRKADMRILQISNEHFVFERYDDNNKAIVIASRSNNQTTIAIPEEYANAKVVFVTEGSNRETLAPYGAIVLKKVINCLNERPPL